MGKPNGESPIPPENLRPQRRFSTLFPSPVTVKIPMADGGDGTLPAIVAVTGGRRVRCAVADPLGRRISSRFGLTGGGRTTVIEMALASGLALLTLGERNPALTTSRGTGELMRAALSRRVGAGAGHQRVFFLARRTGARGGPSPARPRHAGALRRASGSSARLEK